MTSPAPLTPADSDLQDFPFMPLHVARLRDSDFAAEEDPEACWYGVLLWAASWHQVPAGSLPDSDAVLMKIVGLGRDHKTWKKQRAGALRGFILCSDGRLYHPVVAEQVVSAWDSKLRQRHRTFCAAVRKHNERNADDRRDSPTFEAWLSHGRPANMADFVPSLSRVTPPENDCDIGSKREGQGEGQGDSIEEDVGERGREAVPNLPVAAVDLHALNAEACRTAGVKRISPTAIAASLDQIREWITDGALPDEIIATIAASVATATEPIHSLRYFAAAIRQTVARRENLANGRSSASPSAVRAEPGSIRGDRPDPALDLLRAAREAERTSDDRSADWGAGRPVQAAS